MTRRFPLCLAFTILLATGLVCPAEAQVGTNSTLLNPNLATAEELAAVAELDDDTTALILAGRPFGDMLAVDRLLADSLSAEQRTAVYGRVWIPLNLDQASREEILLIPGVGNRMTHEFEEYRPYGALARFRREIGKYVDDTELARLEQYVFVPLNLNTATAEDFMTIPGVGKRMTHEFMEYRPYTNMEQFRREIGKYVDDGEVARLERYMTLD